MTQHTQADIGRKTSPIMSDGWSTSPESDVDLLRDCDGLIDLDA
jgi:hypothetical protein